MKLKNLIRSTCAVCAIVTASAVANAAPITGLFNTGVDGSGVALAAGSNDTHYAILAPAQQAVVIQNSIPGTWLPHTGTRRWVWEDVSGKTPLNVTRTFRTTFDLTGLDPLTAAISGQWATDNTGLDILINGASSGNACGGFSALCNFSIGAGFTSGLNTLDFVVRDSGGWAGLLVSSISGEARESQIGTVPEPATLALFGFGLAGLGFARRKKIA